MSSDKSDTESTIIEPIATVHHIVNLNIHEITALKVQHKGPACNDGHMELICADNRGLHMTFKMKTFSILPEMYIT